MIINIIEDAIKTHKRLFIRYDKDFYEREIEPYAIFESTADKKDLFLIQIRNPAKPLNKKEPRIFTLEDIKTARMGINFNLDRTINIRSLKNCKRVLLSAW